MMPSSPTNDRPDIAILAGSPPVAPKLASVCSIPGHSHRRACCAPCGSLVHRRVLTQPQRYADRGTPRSKHLKHHAPDKSP